LRKRLDAVVERVSGEPRVRTFFLHPDGPDLRGGKRHAPFAAARVGWGKKRRRSRALPASGRRGGRSRQARRDFAGANGSRERRGPCRGRFLEAMAVDTGCRPRGESSSFPTISRSDPARAWRKPRRSSQRSCTEIRVLGRRRDPYRVAHAQGGGTDRRCGERRSRRRHRGGLLDRAT
jgi:hypothetical protein